MPYFCPLILNKRAWKYLKWQGRCKNKEITYLIGCAIGFFANPVSELFLVQMSS